MWSEIQYVPAEQLLETIKPLSDYAPAPDIYIRGQVTHERALSKIPSLIYADENGKAETVRINEAFKVFEVDGVLYASNGNTRRHSIGLMLADSKYKTLKFEPVPYQVYQGKITPEVLLRIQTDSNDTTDAHSVYELALAVNRYWQAQYDLKIKLFETEGKPVTDTIKRKAGTHATRLAAEAFNKTDVRISQLRTVAELPTWLVESYIESDRIQPDLASKIYAYSEKSEIPLTTLFEYIHAQLPPSDLTIKPRHWEAVKQGIEANVDGPQPSVEETSSSEQRHDSDSASGPSGSSSGSPVPPEFKPEEVKIIYRTVKDVLAGIDTEPDIIAESWSKFNQDAIPATIAASGKLLNKLSAIAPATSGIEIAAEFVIALNNLMAIIPVDALVPEDLHEIEKQLGHVQFALTKLVTPVVTDQLEQDEAEEDLEDEREEFDSEDEQINVYLGEEASAKMNESLE